MQVLSFDDHVALVTIARAWSGKSGHVDTRQISRRSLLSLDHFGLIRLWPGDTAQLTRRGDSAIRAGGRFVLLHNL